MKEEVKEEKAIKGINNFVDGLKQKLKIQRIFDGSCKEGLLNRDKVLSIQKVQSLR